MATVEPGPATTEATVDHGSVGPALQNRTCTVIFGRTSFLGQALVSYLNRSGRWTVRIADSAPPLTEPDRFDLPSPVDVSNPSDLLPLLRGSSVVFLVDPTIGAGVDRWSYLHIHLQIVLSARSVAAACAAAGVRSLVYTGSADVVADGYLYLNRANESLPYPDTYVDRLNEFRAQAERIVLLNDGKEGLSTCVLRVCNPFGPGDEFFINFLVNSARSGWAKFIIGSGKNMSDFTYVENVVYANMCAEEALQSDKASISGKPFFITNGEPVKVWEFISNILESLGYPRPRIPVPAKVALLGDELVRWVCEKTGSYGVSKTYISPSIVHALSCTRTFDCSSAQRLLKYTPITSLQEGILRTLDSFSNLASSGSANSRPRDFTKISKAERLLGSGAVAEVLLWRDEKKSFTFAITLFLLYYWYILSGRTFLSSAAKLLMATSAFLFFHPYLPTSRFSYIFEKISTSSFEVPPSAFKSSFVAAASAWNQCAFTLKLVAQGEDWKILFKVLGCLYVMKFIFSFSFSLLIGIGVVFPFILFIIFERYEDELENMLAFSLTRMKKLKAVVTAKLPTSLSQFACQS